MSGAVEMRDVCFGYDERLVLAGLCLEVPAGSVAALLGPNGSGKTTILKLLLGLHRPRSGTIHLLGQLASSLSRQQASRRLGLVPQSEDLPFALTVLEYVTLGRAPYLHLLARPGAADRAIALRALESVGIEHLAGRSVLELSGGEQQLASIARVVAQEPAVMLMDEPSSHLDLKNRRRVLEVMRAQRAQGRTVLLTTHDPNTAAAVASEVLLLRDGALLARGSPREVLTSERLSEVYDDRIEVADVGGRPVVLA